MPLPAVRTPEFLVRAEPALTHSALRVHSLQPLASCSSGARSAGRATLGVLRLLCESHSATARSWTRFLARFSSSRDAEIKVAFEAAIRTSDFGTARISKVLMSKRRQLVRPAARLHEIAQSVAPGIEPWARRPTIVRNASSKVATRLVSAIKSTRSAPSAASTRPIASSC